MASSDSPKKGEGPLLITSWRGTGACNYSCVYCNVNANMKPTPNELDTDWGLRLVDQIYEFGSKWFGLKGGEPLLRKDIFTLIAHAKELGLGVVLLTNGYYVDGEILDKLVKYNVYTSISIDGSEKSNDFLRGPGTYKTALSAIQKLSKAGILNGLSAAITSVNYKDLDHVVDLAEEYGARFVWFNHLVPAGRAKDHLNLEPSPEQYEWALNHLYDLSQKTYKKQFKFHVHCPFYARIYKQRNPENFEEWYKHEFAGKCIYFLFGGYISLLENGDVIPQFYSTDLKVGNIKEKSIKEIWDEIQNSDFFRRLKNPDNLKGKCGVCEYRTVCGGCRTRAYSHTDDWFESDSACAYIPEAWSKK